MERQYSETSCERQLEGLSADLSHDFSAQLDLRIRGEIFEDAAGAHTCVDNRIVGAANVGSITQTLEESTFTLQQKFFQH